MLTGSCVENQFPPRNHVCWFWKCFSKKRRKLAASSRPEIICFWR